MLASVILSEALDLKSSFLGNIQQLLPCNAWLPWFFLIWTIDIPPAWYKKASRAQIHFEEITLQRYWILKGFWKLIPGIAQLGRVHAVALHFHLSRKFVVACVMVGPSEYYRENELREKTNKKKGRLVLSSGPSISFGLSNGSMDDQRVGVVLDSAQARTRDFPSFWIWCGAKFITLNLF